jgi:hypothetical protein
MTWWKSTKSNPNKVKNMLKLLDILLLQGQQRKPVLKINLIHLWKIQSLLKLLGQNWIIIWKRLFYLGLMA